MTVDYLVGEHFKLLVIEGHVDLVAANMAFQKESEGFPEAKHAYMRYADAPEGELQDNWREICEKTKRGAEPVTVSVLEW